jgi:hypothetical protein
MRFILMKLASYCFVIIVLLTLSLPSLVAATAPADVIRSFDLRQYHPEGYGLKSLIFEARINGLEKVLSDKSYLGQVKNLYFKVYWVFPGRSKIEIHGLPSGFKKLRSELQTIIGSRLWMVVPQKLMGQFRSFQLEQKSRADSIEIIAKDPNNRKQVNQIKLLFDQNHRLLQYKSYSPFGVQTTYMKMGVKSWSHNKLVMDKVKVVNQIGSRQNIYETVLEYFVKGRVGLPKRLMITNWNEIDEGKVKGAKEFNQKSRMNGAKFELIFSKFEINSKNALAVVKDKGSAK